MTEHSGATLSASASPGRDSRTGAQDEATAAVDTAGHLLKQARKVQRISLDSAAGDLNLRRDLLDAIEKGDFEELPDAAFAVGFVRSYARYLQLDANEIVGRFKEELADERGSADLILPAPIKQGRMPAGLLVIASIVLAGLVYGSWHLYTEQSDVPNANPGGIATPAATAGGTLASAKGTPSPATAKSDKPAPVGKPGGIVKIAGSAPDGKQAEAGGTAPAKKVAAAPPAAPPARIASRVVLRAVANTWIRVRGADNRIIFTRVLRQGDQYLVPEGRGVVVDIGNAGGLQIVLDGQVLKPVGPSNIPVYNVSLSPDDLRRRQEAAAGTDER